MSKTDKLVMLQTDEVNSEDDIHRADRKRQ